VRATVAGPRLVGRLLDTGLLTCPLFSLGMSATDRLDRSSGRSACLSAAPLVTVNPHVRLTHRARSGHGDSPAARAEDLQRFGPENARLKKIARLSRVHVVAGLPTQLLAELLNHHRAGDDQAQRFGRRCCLHMSQVWIYTEVSDEMTRGALRRYGRDAHCDAAARASAQVRASIASRTASCAWSTAHEA
jgi:hypothetical protein